MGWRAYDRDGNRRHSSFDEKFRPRVGRFRPLGSLSPESIRFLLVFSEGRFCLPGVACLMCCEWVDVIEELELPRGLDRVVVGGFGEGL